MKVQISSTSTPLLRVCATGAANRALNTIYKLGKEFQGQQQQQQSVCHAHMLWLIVSKGWSWQQLTLT